MSVHYEPYPNESDYAETAMCGTKILENYFHSSDWHKVTCKKCLKQKIKIMQEVLNNERQIIKQMKEQVDFEKEKS